MHCIVAQDTNERNGGITRDLCYMHTNSGASCSPLPPGLIVSVLLPIVSMQQHNMILHICEYTLCIVMYSTVHQSGVRMCQSISIMLLLAAGTPTSTLITRKFVLAHHKNKMIYDTNNEYEMVHLT